MNRTSLWPKQLYNVTNPRIGTVNCNHVVSITDGNDNSGFHLFWRFISIDTNISTILNVDNGTNNIVNNINFGMADEKYQCHTSVPQSDDLPNTVLKYKTDPSGQTQ
mmetsp:Transcript_24278/g.57496  ORF Transcript_24278/g.57496 Transcript_24278/m.57496 type:complete len:107 (-) Transcript_24278:1038-1358(-)